MMFWAENTRSRVSAIVATRARALCGAVMCRGRDGVGVDEELLGVCVGTHSTHCQSGQHVTHNDLVFPEAGHELLEHMAVVAQLFGEGYSPTAQRAFDHRPTPPLPCERDNPPVRNK
jgi:hypothetical protein